MKPAGDSDGRRRDTKMKRIMALILVLALAAFSAVALAEQGGTPPGDFGSSDGGPAGGMPGGTPPEGFGGEGGFPAGGTPPEGFEGFDGSEGGPTGGFPGGTPPEGFDGPSGGPAGGFPGSSGEKAEGQIGSWSMGGHDANSAEGDDYAYDAAIWVAADGIDADKSAADRVTGGTYDAKEASGIVIDDSASGHNGIIVLDADYTVSGAKITMLTEADGTDTSDFSGKGSAIAAYGADTHVTVENSEIHTAGVATMPVFADDGATVTVRSSVLQSDGGTLHSGYLNTPTQTLMVAPPWILGIMGTSRCSNLMGNDTTVNVVDSETSAGAWAVLSTDSGTRMALNVYNSSLTLNNKDESAVAIQAEGGQISESLDNPYTENYGSGYGTFVIGSAVEKFYGTTFNVGTYATILTGGSATYTALEAGKTYELKDSAGETIGTYEAAGDKATEIHSDTFGFMAHQNANTVVVEKGTKIDTGYATFLLKTGYSGQATTASVDGAEIRNGGVLIQVIDNDDATNGGMMKADDPLNTDGGNQNFIPYHTEEAGFRTEASAAGGDVQNFTFTNGVYTGNIYNASGSDGLNPSALNVTFGEGAAYTGAIASTAAIHVTYDGSAAVKAEGGYAFDDSETAAVFAAQYQNTYFTINEYWSIGQVANLVNDNGGNAIHVALKDGAEWTVAGTSLVASLEIGEGCRVVIPNGVTLTVNGVSYTDCILDQ